MDEISAMASDVDRLRQVYTISDDTKELIESGIHGLVAGVPALLAVLDAFSEAHPFIKGIHFFHYSTAAI